MDVPKNKEDPDRLYAMKNKTVISTVNDERIKGLLNDKTFPTNVDPQAGLDFSLDCLLIICQICQ
jgi:hypothetical protein